MPRQRRTDDLVHVRADVQDPRRATSISDRDPESPRWLVVKGPSVRQLSAVPKIWLLTRERQRPGWFAFSIRTRKLGGPSRY